MSHHYRARMTTGATFLVGLTAALAGGAVGALLGRVAKPLAVGAIKQRIAIRENARARAAELREDIDDLVARAEHEYRAERIGRTGEPPRQGA